jgi:outer membrane protein
VVKNKKQAKIVAVAVVAFFVLGIVGLALSQTGKGYAAGASSSSNIGVVNYQMILQQHPDAAKVEQTMNDEIAAAQKDFNEKTANMNDKEKQDYYMQVQQRLQQKQQELVVPVHDSINAAIKTVAEAKSLSVVLAKDTVVYGGQDITDEVVKKVSGK